MTTKYIVPNSPFILFSMGMPGYGGECELWKLPEAEVTVFHILARIKHETKSLKKRTGRDFYLFGTRKNLVAAKERFIKELQKRPIDIFFTVNLSNRGQIEDIEAPDTSKLKRSAKGWRTMVNLDNGKETRVPKEINLWGSKRPYYGLAISEFRPFAPTDRQCLDGKHLFYYRTDSPLKTWVQFTMGALYQDPKKKGRNVEPRRILATAKLVYPYIFEVRK